MPRSPLRPKPHITLRDHWWTVVWQGDTLQCSGVAVAFNVARGLYFDPTPYVPVPGVSDTGHGY